MTTLSIHNSVWLKQIVENPAHMTNDELHYYTQKMYPALVPGRDYLIRTQWEDLEGGGEALKGDAHYSGWYTNIPEPTAEQLATMKEKYWQEFVEWRLGDAVRAQRIERLADADKMVQTAEDDEDADAEKSARAYRKALRDLTDQPGFPWDVQWPQKQGKGPTTFAADVDVVNLDKDTILSGIKTARAK
ncbi:tail fiber assembly protein [Burkholderia phage Bm1]